MCIDEKIPPMELAFIQDQRAKVGHKGKMQMSRPDLPETLRLQQAHQRKKNYKLGQDLLQAKHESSVFSTF